MNKKSPEISITNESIDSYHARNCTICRHPDRAAIEYDFLHWRDGTDIFGEYHISRRSLYRHAHAVGLFARRRANLRSALELMIENAGSIRFNGATILRAIQLYARMNETGQIAEEVPRTQHIVVSHGAPCSPPQAQISASLSVPIDQIAPPNTDLTLLNEPNLPKSELLTPLEAPLEAVEPDPNLDPSTETFPYQLDTQSQTEFDLSP